VVNEKVCESADDAFESKSSRQGTISMIDIF
jgi:hypothetical protein